MINANVQENLEKYNQMHVLKYENELNPKELEILYDDLNELDFHLMDVCNKYISAKNCESKKSVYEPLEALKLEEINAKKEEYDKIGIKAIKECRVGAVLLAGGQGTRLGFDKPKGMFNIGINKEVFIFQRLIENLLEVVKLTGAYVPLFIMTSDKNDIDTRGFFKENNYFGYDKDYIFFFVQEMAPSVDYNGKLLMEEKNRLSLSPNGNGGWFSSMVKANLLSKIHDMGIQWLNVFSVDNVLQRIADVTFIGATIKSGKPAGSKVVKKAFKDERVGVMCKENNKPSIVEYYELTKEMMDAVDASGEPAYNYGVILNYLLNVNSLEKILDEELPVHIVEKKIPYIDYMGKKVSPEKPNGYKFEELILDMIRLMDDCLVFEVVREKEFAPVKNREGVDSINTARELLKLNGIEI